MIFFHQFTRQFFRPIQRITKDFHQKMENKLNGKELVRFFPTKNLLYMTGPKRFQNISTQQNNKVKL